MINHQLNLGNINIATPSKNLVHGKEFKVKMILTMIKDGTFWWINCIFNWFIHTIIQTHLSHTPGPVQIGFQKFHESFALLFAHKTHLDQHLWCIATCHSRVTIPASTKRFTKHCRSFLGHGLPQRVWSRISMIHWSWGNMNSEAKTSFNRILMFGFVHELMEFWNTTFELSSCRSHLWPLLGTCSLHHLLPSCASWSHSLRTLVSKTVPGR